MPRYRRPGHVDPNRLEEVSRGRPRRLAQLLEALRDAGWRNVLLFLSDDGLLIGYAEADDCWPTRRNGWSRPRSVLAGRPPWRELFEDEGASTRPGRSSRSLRPRRSTSQRPGGLIAAGDDS